MNGSLSSSVPVVIGTGCFNTVTPPNAALSSAAFITAYNIASTAVLYEASYGIIQTNSVALRAALIAQINIALQASGGIGSSFSSSACSGAIPTTVASYCQ